jgi:hypothetical protein
MANIDFEKILQDAGLPTTEEELTADWQTVLDEQNNPITNNSKWSPFRRLIDAIVVKPAKQILDSIITVSLPNQFVLTASAEALELKAADLNLTRNAATKTVGVVTFTRENTTGQLSLPIGTIVQTPLINGVTYQLTTTTVATFANGISTTTANAIATQAGAIYNLPTEYYSQLASPIDGVTVSNDDDWIITPGQDTETDDDLRQRCKNQFNLVGEYHTDAVYKGILSQTFGIRTDDIYFVHNAPRGPGTANCYILLPTGNPSTQFLTDINTYITDDGNHGHGDDLIVYAMPETTNNITVDIWPIDDLTTEQNDELTTGVETFIRAAFRENLLYSATTTQPQSVFSFSRLAQELHSEFSNLQRLVFTTTDITSALAIARIDTLTVTNNG